MPDRKYGHDEIQRILKKATEKQQKAHEVSRPEVGLSIEEIERIASEAGIDPKFVREAAWESKTLDDDRKHSWLLGGMTSMKVERSIPAEVPRSLLDTELVPVIREQSGKTGQFEKLGESLTWTDNEAPGASYSKVQITSKNGTTDIVVESTKNVKQTSYALLVLAALMIVFSIAGIAKNGLDPGIIIAMPFLFTAIAMRFGYASFSRKLEQRLENVTNALEDKVLEIGTLNQSTGGRQATSETVHDTTRRGPLLDLESDQDTSPESETRPNRNRDSV